MHTCSLHELSKESQLKHNILYNKLITQGTNQIVEDKVQFKQKCHQLTVQKMMS